MTFVFLLLFSLPPPLLRGSFDSPDIASETATDSREGVTSRAKGVREESPRQGSRMFPPSRPAISEKTGGESETDDHLLSFVSTPSPSPPPRLHIL